MQRNSKKSFFSAVSNPWDTNNCVDITAIPATAQVSVNAGSCLPDKTVSSGYSAPLGTGYSNANDEVYPGKVPCNKPISSTNPSGGASACYGIPPPPENKPPVIDYSLNKSGKYIDTSKQKYIYNPKGVPLFTSGGKYSCSSDGVHCTTMPNDLNCGNYYSLNGGQCYQLEDPYNQGTCIEKVKSTSNTRCFVGNTATIGTIQGSHVFTGGTSNTITPTTSTTTAPRSTTPTNLTQSITSSTQNSSPVNPLLSGNTASVRPSQPSIPVVPTTSITTATSSTIPTNLTQSITSSTQNSSPVNPLLSGNTASVRPSQPSIPVVPSSTTTTTTTTTNRPGGVTKKNPIVRFNGNVGSKSNFGMSDTTKTTLMIVGAVLLILLLLWYFMVYNKK